LAAAFWVAAIALALRAIGALFTADPTRALLSPTGLGAALVLVAFAAGLAHTLGFLLLQTARAESEAERLATMDPLTGAYNRRTFHEIAEREMSRAVRAGQPLSIIMLDVDHFRALNDRFGHRVGDELLQKVIEIVRGALRKED